MKYLILIILMGCQTIDHPKLVWSDEFNTNGKTRRKKVDFDLGNGENGWGNSELEYYTNDPK
ncbi:MAG: glycoside hydrolase family 16 protein, partial [Bacteroidota bacterium]